MGFIEGGWPGANPKDTEFFRRARTELDLKHAQLAAFGATRRPGAKAADDPLVAALRDSGAPVVTLVAKSHDRHVELALRTTLEENLAMVRDTVVAPAGGGPARLPRRRALLRRLPQRPGVRARGAPGRRPRRAPTSPCCATPTAGCCPTRSPTSCTRSRGDRRPGSGIHCHNDTGCAVANSLAAVDAGRDPRAGHPQRLRRAHRQRRHPHRRRQPASSSSTGGCCRRAACARATRIAHAVSELANVPPYSRQPYVGASAFAHKAGLHASAIRVDPMLYQHDRPGGGRQRHADARLRHGGPRIDRAQGPRAGLRPRRQRRAARPGHRRRSRSWRPRLHVRGCRRVVRAAAARAEVEGAPPDFFDVESWRVIVDARGDGVGRRRRRR